jgi:hypothetical protein
MSRSRSRSRPVRFRLRRDLVLGGLTLVAWARVAGGGELLHEHCDHGPPPPGRPRCIPHTHDRAGWPLNISAHAHPTRTPAYIGYYVGGGATHGGCDRRAEDGTWGRDYQGHWIPRHVWLGWYHGSRQQSGTGYYKTDGPFVPDVIGLTASKIRNH